MSQISKCCQSKPISQIHNGDGICSTCKEHAEFESEFQCKCGAEVKEEGDPCTVCAWSLKH